MGTRARRIAVLLVAALAAPAVASADGPEPTGGTTSPAPTGGTVAPESEPGLIATPHVLVGKVARFRGTFSTRDAGRAVTVERFDARTEAWTAVAGATVREDGSYVARWRADVTGATARARCSRATARRRSPRRRRARRR